MAENAIVSAPPALLDTCLKIVKTLHGVQQWMKPAPLTMTSLANECLGLHEMLTQGRDRMDAAQNHQSQLVKTMEGFLLGCSMTVSVVDEYAMELHDAVTLFVSTITDTALKADIRLLWKEEDMKELLSQTRGHQKRLLRLLDSFDKTDTLRQTSEPAIGNHSALINLLNRSHLSFQTRPNSIRSSLRDSFTSLDPSPPYALFLNGDITDAIKRVAEDVTLYLSNTDSVAGVRRSKSSVRAENVPEETVASNEDDRLRQYDEPSNLRTRESNPTPALAVAAEESEDDGMYGPMLSGSYQPHIHGVESSTLVVDTSSNINATVANNVNTEVISTLNQLITRPAEAAAPNSNPVPVLLYTIAIAGSEDSGKSELVNWFLHSGLDEESVLKVYSGRLCAIDDANVVVDLIDNIGQKHYASMRYNHLSRAEGILLLYKISSRASFEEVQLIEQLVSRMEEERANRNIPKHPVLLVAYGIGSEAVQHVSREEGQALALKSGCTFIELRGRDYASFQEAVYDVTRLVRKQYSNYTPHYPELPDRPHFGPTVMDTKESQTVSEREERSLTRNLFKEIRKRRRG